MQNDTLVSEASESARDVNGGTRAEPSRFRTGLRKSLKWLFLVLAVAVLLYKVKLAPVAATRHTAGPGTVIAVVMGTGTLEARVKTTVSARIQERLAEVLVDQDDFVKAGALLARLDDGELKRQVEVATANLAAADATLERVKIDQDRARAVETQAKLTHQRVSELMATKVTSQDELDKAIEALHVAEADARRAHAAIIEAETQKVAAERNLAQQQERLTFTRLVSPYDGLIVRRDRDPGEIVVPGTSILHLISTNEVWVSAWVDETVLGSLMPGQPARVVFRSEPGTSYAGAVARVGRETDRETREFLVDVRVKSLPQRWAVGQRAEVFIETARKEAAVSIPVQFLAWRSGKPGVFVDQSGRARWREIQLGLRGSENVEVLEGLAASETVLKPVQSKKGSLAEGRRVAAP